MNRALHPTICVLLATALLCGCGGPSAQGRPAYAPAAAIPASAEAAPGSLPSGSPAPSPAAREEGAVLIRLRNAADTLELRSAFAIFPDDTVLFGDIAPKGVSAYHAVKRSYRYAYVRATAEGREWTLQPADYVGERLLEPGRYTWSIKPHDGPYPGFLDFEAERDE